MKQLHLANIANVACSYAKILREVGAAPYDPYTTRMAHPYDGEHLFRIDQLFVSLEKPALESWRAQGS